ncbi:hypothetical protein [Angustibacter luteus]|uniref:Uncharacterized protein n=1 Tax=Angustibacter luteus TaxID=658456 RepID=A0ABW1JJQ4_9ACTN
MTLSTDELRAALDEASHAPYDAASSARLSGVRARVRQRQRRRTGGAAGLVTVAMVAVAAVATGLTAGNGPGPVTAASPSPTSSAVAALPPLPVLYRGQGVLAQLSGADDESPAKQVVLPASSSGGIVVRCAGPKDAALDDGTSVLVSADLGGTAVAPHAVTCLPDGEPVDGTILATVDPKAGAAIRLQARFDRPVPAGSTFSVAVLDGENVIDLSPLRKAPAGYAFVSSLALSDGWVYASGSPDGAETSSRDDVLGGAEIIMEQQRSVHLVVRCIGRQQLLATTADGGRQTVSCPAGERVTKTVDLTLKRSAEQRLRLDVSDADPGALVEVGVYSR